MIAREDKRLVLFHFQLFLLRVVFGGFYLLNIDVVLDKIHERVTSQYIFPQVTSAVRIARFFLVLKRLVEREETGLFAFQFCGHIDLFGAYCKMDEAAFELQQWFAFGFAVAHILLNRIHVRLSCLLVFKFNRCNRKTIDEKSKVYLVLLVLRPYTIAQLAYDGKSVLVI